MSTALSAAVATPAPSSTAPTARSGPSIAIPQAVAGGATMCAQLCRPAAPEAGPFRRDARAAGVRRRCRRSTASRWISACPRCRSTRPNAAFPSASTVRWTCAWASSGPSAADLGQSCRRRRARRHHLQFRRRAPCPRDRPRHRERAQDQAVLPHAASWRKSCAAPMPAAAPTASIRPPAPSRRCASM